MQTETKNNPSCAFKGTPGPWLVDGKAMRGDKSRNGATVAVANTLNVAWPYGRRAIKEEPYNARITAAAPELLEALMEIINESRRFVMTADTHRKARSVIAKALGEYHE